MENQIIQVDGTLGTCSSAAACYFYDTQGRRVQKIIGSAETSYLFDLSGHVVAEDNGTNWRPGYVYAGGQLIAEYKNSTTFFVHDNNIGTSPKLWREPSIFFSPDSRASIPISLTLFKDGNRSKSAPLKTKGAPPVRICATYVPQITQLSDRDH